MDKVRAFIAVEVPPSIHSKLSKLQNLLASSRADVKWVAEENFHVTMKFLGNLEASMVDSLTDAIVKSVAKTDSFSAEAVGLGAFPKLANPSVIWAGISSGANELSEIASSLEYALFALGIKKEEKKFSAHITLGRARSRKGAESLRVEMEKHIAEKIGSFNVNRITLMKSDLRPSGPVYTPLAYINLKSSDEQSS